VRGHGCRLVYRIGSIAEFFRVNKLTGKPKLIVAIRLRGGRKR
jgi:hypothetical protein